MLALGSAGAMQQGQDRAQGDQAQGRGERSEELYGSEDLGRIDKVLHQPNFAPERRPFRMWKLLGLFFGGVGSLSLLAWGAANLVL